MVIQGLIDQFHPQKDVAVTVPLDLLEKAEQTQRMFTLILRRFAGISLVVGGIGIANIMLATVTERTRDRRAALGAAKRDIAVQFLVETLVLSCGGGVIGVVLGVILSHALTWASACRPSSSPGPRCWRSRSRSVGLASGLPQA